MIHGGGEGDDLREGGCLDSKWERWVYTEVVFLEHSSLKPIHIIGFPGCMCSCYHPRALYGHGLESGWWCLERSRIRRGFYNR